MILTMPKSDLTTTRRTSAIGAAVVVAIIGLGLSGLAWISAKQQLAERANELIVMQGESLASAIGGGAAEVEAELRAVAGLFEASDEVTEEHFDMFVARIHSTTALVSIGYAPLLSADELSEFLPIRFSDGVEDHNGGLGFDLWSISERRPLIELALESGEVVTSALGPLPLTGERGYVVYQPISNGSGEVAGLVIGHVLYLELIGAAVPESLGRDLEWTVSDGVAPLSADEPGLTHRFQMVVGGRTWVLDAAPLSGSAFAIEVWRPAAILALALAVLTLIGAFATYTFWSKVESDAHLEEMSALIADKDHFVATVSHELRTPLAALLGFSELLREASFNRIDEIERDEMITVIAEQASDLTNIVDDLLVVARADHGTLTAVSVPVDLAAQCRQVVEQLTARRDVIVQIGPECWNRRAVGDPARVRQIIRNLLNNAIAYGGPDVRLSVHIEDTEMVVHVRDDGLGVPEAQAEDIFFAYHRAHDVGPTTGSLGLGLSVSRTLARHMKGDLKYRRTSGFTIFELRLPLQLDPVEVADRFRDVFSQA